MSATKQKFIDAVVKGITELPDRSSPEGHPELMQCTAEEVVDVLLVVYREHIAALEADAARLDYIEKNARTDPKMDGNHVFWPTTLNKALRGANLRAAIDDAMKGGA